MADLHIHIYLQSLKQRLDYLPWPWSRGILSLVILEGEVSLIADIRIRLKSNNKSQRTVNPICLYQAVDNVYVQHFDENFKLNLQMFNFIRHGEKKEVPLLN